MRPLLGAWPGHLLQDVRKITMRDQVCNLAAAVLIGWMPAAAQSQEDASLSGAWVLSAESQARFAEPCRNMRFEITDGSYVTRTTGALVYTTSVRLIAAGRGFLLDETLEQHNGGKACSGAPASEVLQHLEAQAYIEIGGDTLRYYRHQGDPAYIAFVRTDV